MVEKKFDLRALIGLLILIVGTFFMLAPFIWMILTSFKTFPETMMVPIKWLPDKVIFDNYAVVFQKMDFGTFYKNTIIMAVFVVFGQVMLSSVAAFSFARIKFPARDFIFFTLLCVLMVPSQMTLIPRYKMVEAFGWVDSYLGLIVPVIPSAYGTFFIRQFFKTVPNELEESARIDGCSYGRIYISIFLPLAKSTLIAFGITSLLWCWNELLWPLVVTNSQNMRVLSIGIANMRGQYANIAESNIVMAASILATTPMLLAFIFGQKRFIEGIVVTGLKA